MDKQCRVKEEREEERVSWRCVIEQGGGGQLRCEAWLGRLSQVWCQVGPGL
jgi:hypothetical protein